MISQERMLAILRQLLEKSRENQVEWKVREDPFLNLTRDISKRMLRPDQETKKLEYMVVFPESQLGIFPVEPEVAADFYRVSFYNKKNDRVASFSFNEGDAEWSLVSELYEEADRRVMGWDKVFDDIEATLRKSPAQIDKAF